MSSRDIEFLKDLKLMVTEHNLPYAAPWSQVPLVYRRQFMDWTANVKQQTWDDMRERGWSYYQFEFLAYILEREIRRDNNDHN